MLMDLRKLVRDHGLRIDGVLHLGANVGEERTVYERVGVGPVWWVEGNTDSIPELTANLAGLPHHHIIETLVSDREQDAVEFMVTDNAQSSSLLDFGTHAVVSPDVHEKERRILPTRTVDSLVSEHRIRANTINADLQGAELLAFMGGQRFIAEQVEYIYCEINCEILYRDCALFHDLTRWLYDRGFVVQALAMAGSAGWGDCLYRRVPER